MILKSFLQALCKAGAPYEEVIQLLDKQPTAYDIDKVVIETRKELDKLLYICDLEDTTKVYDFYDWLEQAIRKGDITE